jgi:ATP-dependent DNA ligase
MGRGDQRGFGGGGNGLALLFYAFDILICRGENMMTASLVKRRKALDNLFENLGNKAALISLSDTIDATPADLVREIEK